MFFTKGYQENWSQRENLKNKNISRSQRDQMICITQSFYLYPYLSNGTKFGNTQNEKSFCHFEGILWPRKIWAQTLKDYTLRNMHQTSMGVGSLFMRSLHLSYEIWFRKVKKFQFFIIEVLEGPSGQEKRTYIFEYLKNQE